MQRVCHAKKNQNASKRGTIETSSLRFARSKPQKNELIDQALPEINSPNLKRVNSATSPCNDVQR